MLGRPVLSAKMARLLSSSGTTDVSVARCLRYARQNQARGGDGGGRGGHGGNGGHGGSGGTGGSTGGGAVSGASAPSAGGSSPSDRGAYTSVEAQGVGRDREQAGEDPHGLVKPPLLRMC